MKKLNYFKYMTMPEARYYKAGDWLFFEAEIRKRLPSLLDRHDWKTARKLLEALKLLRFGWLNHDTPPEVLRLLWPDDRAKLRHFREVQARLEFEP